MKYILVLFLFFSTVYGKKDFYYSFINSSGVQISEIRKQQIRDGFDLIENARNLSRNGKLDEAFTQISSFKDKNKLKVLESDILLLYAELALKKDSTRIINETAKELEDAINSSKINDYDLAKAYRLLVDLKLELNKSNEAKYFANIVVNNFDDELTKTYGKISLAKVYKYRRETDNAIRILYEILTETKDKLVATVVANELFDLYIYNEDYEKANELISQILKNNIEFYAQDSYLANKKINKLIDANMPHYAAEILKELLKRTTKEESIEDFKFKLANVYMQMYDGTNYYLEKAKELYKDIINDYAQGAYVNRAKMYIDEILMRQGILKPTVVANKYRNSEAMQQKALMQELLNKKDKQQFEEIIKTKRVYRQISNSIAQRFGYDSMLDLFDEINIDRIKMLLNNDQCFKLSEALKVSQKSTFIKLVKNETLKYKFFECLIDAPYQGAYNQLKSIFSTSRDGNIYLYLERMALSLKNYEEALGFSAKVEMVNERELLSREFLTRYKVLKSLNDTLALEKFFSYANRNKEFIKQNSNDPVITDFYYDYYLYLLKREREDQANEVLRKLYNKQNEIKAHIYSPFVEMELAKQSKDNQKTNEALEYLLEAVENTRRMKPNDKAKVFYELIKTYQKLDNEIKQQEYITKCKEITGTTGSLYKKMCDEM